MVQPKFGKATPVDEIGNENTAKANKYKSTASQRDKLRLAMLELNDEIVKNNDTVTRLIDRGFIEQAIEMFFGLKYMNYNDELQNILRQDPTYNLQYSGVGEIPIYDPSEVLTLLEILAGLISGTERTSSAVTQRIMQLNNKIKELKAEQEKKRADALQFVGDDQPETQYFTGVTSSITFLRLFLTQFNRSIPFTVTSRTQVDSKGIPRTVSITTIASAKYPPAEILKLLSDILNLISIQPGMSPKIISDKIEQSRKGKDGDTSYVEISNTLINNTERLLLEAIYKLINNFLEETHPEWIVTDNSVSTGDSVKKPDDRPVEDRTYDQITTAFQLTPEQNQILLNIIEKIKKQLKDIKQEMKDDDFFNRVNEVFKTVLDELIKTGESERTQTPRQNLFTDFFNMINENSDFIIELVSMILDPKNKVPAKLKRIINDLTTATPATPTTSSYSSSSSDASLGLNADNDVSLEEFLNASSSGRDDFMNNLKEPSGREYKVEREFKEEPRVEEPIIENSPDVKELLKQLNSEIKKGIKKVRDRLLIAPVEQAVEMQSIFNRARQVANEVRSVVVPAQISRFRRILNSFGRFSFGRRFYVTFTHDGITTTNVYLTEDDRNNFIDELADEERRTMKKTTKYGLIKKPDGGDGGPPVGGGDVIYGLPFKDWFLLIIIMALIIGGSVKLSDIFKEEKPKTEDTGDKPPAPPAPPDKPSKDDSGNYNKIAHNEFWDSVGLGTIIDTYNIMVDKYNGMSKADKKTFGDSVEKYYDKFAEIVKLPTLSELKEARERYDGIKLRYDQAIESGASFELVNGIYFELTKSMTYLNKMTDKYLAIENKTFNVDKGKDDADVTIDDVDASVSINTSLKGGKGKAVIDSNYAVLSKGMTERIKRKLMNKESNFMSGIMDENQRFNDFSLIKKYDYPTGVGLDNPIAYRNKQYEIMKYTNNTPNPQPFKVPSMNTLIKSSKQTKPDLYNVIQIDNRMDDLYGFKYMGLQNPNIDPNKFIKSRLFNPEYGLEQINKNRKPVETLNDTIRSGPYVGIKDNQYYQYANIQKKQSDKLNEQPMTTEMSFGIKDIKKSRKLPNSYSLKG